MALVVVVGLGLLQAGCDGGWVGAPGGEGPRQSRPGGPARIGGGGGKGLIKGGGTVTLTGAAGVRGGAGGGGGAGGRGGAGGAAAGAAGPGTGGAAGEQPRFSFFVTSLSAMQELSGSREGFGGDLRFGQTGPGAGLRGADEICRTIAERSLPGAGAKIWRAFLSTTTGGLDGGPVHAIDRVGGGPWFDRLGRLVALGPDDLVHERPLLADPAIVDDLPNEAGIPNHSDGAPGCTGNACPDNHDVLTGTGVDGKLHLEDPGFTCDDWTTAALWGSPWCGHSWPRSFSGNNWMSALPEGGCAPGVNLEETGAPTPGVRTVGTGGGYGAIYCFALSP